MNIRIATPEDAFAIQNIYRYYVDNTAITFELEVPSVKEFQERITKTLERYPYLVAEEEGEVIAYAYAGIFYDRRAYVTGQRKCLFMCREEFTEKVWEGLFMRRWKSC